MAKSKAELMRETRARRKAAGLRALTLWVSDRERRQLEQLLEAMRDGRAHSYQPPKRGKRK